MRLGVQKRLAAQLLKTSEKRVWFDETRLEDIKEAITKVDIRALISKGVIQLKHKKCKSRSKARERKIQKTKGRRTSHGSRKGKKKARTPKKITWMNKIRAQRGLIKRMRDNNKIEKITYQDLYKKTKGGFFRSTRHIKVYLEERKLIK